MRARVEIIGRLGLDQVCFPGVRPTNRSHSTGEKYDCLGRNGLRTIMVRKKNQWSSSILPMIIQDHHFQSAYTWMRGGEHYFSPVIIPPPTKGEMTKLFGIITLATSFEFGDRASLWSTIYQAQYRSAPAFGNNGINMHSVNMLWKHVRCIHQPYV